MNTSQFMDKQIMDLSNSQKNTTRKDDLIDLIKYSRQEEQHPQVGDGGAKKDEMLPNYDFQPIHPLASSQQTNFDSNNVGGARIWSSVESKTNSGFQNYGFVDSTEPAKVDTKDCDVYDALISEIDKKMKKHTDTLMHVLEGVSARLSQLENKSRHMENSIDDLKASIGNNHGNTDGKLRQIENTIREVQAGVQVVKDKHEKLEAQLQISKVKQQSETQIPGHMESLQHAAAAMPLQSHHQLPSTLPNAPPPPTPLNQFPQNITPVTQHDAYYQPSGQTLEAPPQHYQPLPGPPPPQAAPPSPQRQYQPPPPPHQHTSLTSVTPTQSQPPAGHHEPPYLQPPSYLVGIHQPGGIPPSSQKFYGTPSQMYEPPSSAPGPASYGLSSYSYGGSPTKPQRHNMGPVGVTGYAQIPMAKILPTASGVSSGSGSSSSNRVPIDDVVDKVTSMGFPRDEVGATVRRLTENGQAVDLNVVLDKLMTDGVESQGPRGWFGR